MATREERKLVYCSGPLFCPEERAGMQRIAEALESAGFDTFLPHRDGLERYVLPLMRGSLSAGALAMPAATALSKAVFALDIYQIVERCHALLFNMNGRVPDEGGVAETAVAFSLGKPLVLYKNDSRGPYAGMDNSMVLGLSAAFSAVGQIERIPAAMTSALERAEQPYPAALPPNVDRTVARGRRVWRLLQALPSLGDESEPKRLELLIGLADADGN